MAETNTQNGKSSVENYASDFEGMRGKVTVGPAFVARKIYSLGDSSAKYGACEVCKTHASEVFIKSAGNGKQAVFGHEGCLKAQ